MRARGIIWKCSATIIALAIAGEAQALTPAPVEPTVEFDVTCPGPAIVPMRHGLLELLKGYAFQVDIYLSPSNANPNGAFSLGALNDDLIYLIFSRRLNGQYFIQYFLPPVERQFDDFETALLSTASANGCSTGPIKRGKNWPNLEQYRSNVLAIFNDYRQALREKTAPPE